MRGGHSGRMMGLGRAGTSRSILSAWSADHTRRSGGSDSTQPESLLDDAEAYGLARPPPLSVMDRVDATTAADVAYRLRHAARGRSARNLGSLRSLTNLGSLGSLNNLHGVPGGDEAAASYVDAWAASRRRWAALRAYGKGGEPKESAAAAGLSKSTSQRSCTSSAAATSGGSSEVPAQTAAPASSSESAPGGASALPPPRPPGLPQLDVAGYDGRRSDQSDNSAAAGASRPQGTGGWWRPHFVEPSCHRTPARPHFGFGLGLRRERDSPPGAVARSESGSSDIDPQERMRILEKIMGHLGGHHHDGAKRDRPGRFVLDPLSERRMVWDLIMCVIILYSAVEIPFSSSFLWAPPLPLRVLDILIDSLLLFDVLICFVTGYVDADDKKTMDQYLVARHYFRGWFVFDLVSAMPFDAIARSFLAPEDRTSAYQNQAFRIVNVLKLLRLVRLQKLVRYLFRWNDDLGLASSHSLFTQTTCILFLLFLFVHTVGCIEFLVPMLAGFPTDSWPLLLRDENVTQSCAVLIEAFQNSTRNHSFVGSDGVVVTLDRPFDPSLDDFEPHVLEARWNCYSHAFFQSLSQMLCIGFGLVNPKRTDELWLTIFSMGLGAAMYAMSLSFVVNVISTVDYPSRSYKNAMEELNEYMRVRCLAPELRMRLRNYFVSLYPNRRIFDEGALVSRFSRSLTLEIHTSRCEALFAAMPLFSDKDEHGNDAEPALLSAICSMLSPEMAFPGEWLTEQGHVCGRVCFIERGVVEVLVDQSSTAQMGDGTYIGEISALGDQLGLGSEAGFATASVRALQYCHLHAVSKGNFRWLAATFPAAFGLPMRNIAKLRLDRARPAQRLGASVDERSSISGGMSVRGTTAAGEESTSTAPTRRSTAALANMMTDDDVQQFLTQQREAQSQMMLKSQEERLADEAALAEESSRHGGVAIGVDKVVRVAAAARAFKRILIAPDRRSLDPDAPAASEEASSCSSTPTASRQASARRGGGGGRWLPRAGSSLMLGELTRPRIRFSAGAADPPPPGASQLASSSEDQEGAHGNAAIKRRPTVTFRDSASDNV